MQPTRRRRWPRRLGWSVLALALLAAVGTLIPFAWTRIAAAGHVFAEDDPAVPQADVALVLGAQIAPGGTYPLAFLQGRLDTAADLLRSGHVSTLLVSGDGHGVSGNEPQVMTDYLTGVGIAPTSIVADPYGLDTYDSCVRARQVYGVTRAIVVTQAYHIDRAVALCRHAGIDATGVVARCDDCRTSTLATNRVRDYFACLKALWDVWRDRPPAVTSPPAPIS